MTAKINRSNELAKLKKFLELPGSSFTFLRGRRRVGKTWLLREFQKNTPNCLYFMGLEDADDSRLRRSFAECWQEYCGDSSLRELSDNFRSWQRIFKHITDYAKNLKLGQLTILLDEIQWIAKKNSGFISYLKQFWVF